MRMALPARRRQRLRMARKRRSSRRFWQRSSGNQHKTAASSSSIPRTRAGTGFSTTSGSVFFPEERDHARRLHSTPSPRRFSGE